MTFLTKPSLVIKKTPLIEGKCDEDVIEVHEGGTGRVSGSGVVCVALTALLVLAMGAATGTALYRQYVRGTSLHRYQGYCTIPINIKEPAWYESKYSVMPLRWSSEPEVQVVSAAGDADRLVAALTEELDIGDTVEKISVLDNGRHAQFIHDFEINITGIIDAERCFAMELEGATTLAPDVFVVAIEGGRQFDVSRVRSSVHAALPALAARAAPDLARACHPRPVYELLKHDHGPVRKRRSMDAVPHDYIHFAGRHLHEIHITNLQDVIAHEQAPDN